MTPTGELPWNERTRGGNCRAGEVSAFARVVEQTRVSLVGSEVPIHWRYNDTIMYVARERRERQLLYDNFVLSRARRCRGSRRYIEPDLHPNELPSEHAWAFRMVRMIAVIVVIIVIAIVLACP